MDTEQRVTHWWHPSWKANQDRHANQLTLGTSLGMNLESKAKSPEPFALVTDGFHEHGLTSQASEFMFSNPASHSARSVTLPALYR